MLSLLKCKCLFGFLWTSAIAAGLLSIIFFSFIDPFAIAALMNIDVDSVAFSFKVYAAVFIFFWFTLNTSTYLAFYFGQLLKKMEQEEEESQNRNHHANSETGTQIG